MSSSASEIAKVRVHPTLEDLVELQYQAKGFSLLPKQPVESLLAGRHASRLRGRGLTFEELRGYRPGDDIRAIDWKATARLRSPHVRVYSEERERPVLLVVDQRSPMFFGSQRTTKATAAAEVAALSAWRVLDVKDRVGAIVFGDDEIVQIRPQRSRQTVMRICNELIRLNRKLSASSPRSSPENFNAALQRAVNVANHDYLVVLVTDYDGANEETRKLCTRLAAHNDVLAVLTYDPFGIQLPDAPGLEVTDGENAISVPEGGNFPEGFAECFEKKLENIRSVLGSIRIPVLPICTHDPVSEQVLDALGAHR
jgi:uncharacterized protein (DUF58 family)